MKLSDTGINKLYFDWLYKLVGGSKGPCSNYYYLMRTLFSIDYYWLVPNDDNRAEDGKSLRTKFSSETGEIDDYFLYQCCSVLEMMVGLAHRIETDITYDPDKSDHTGVWFYEMLDNLGLSDCTDDIWDDQKQEKTMKTIMDMMDRNYSFNGFGGLYPLKKPKEDQRNVEIWKQMSAYFIEKGR